MCRPLSLQPEDGVYGCSYWTLSSCKRLWTLRQVYHREQVFEALKIQKEKTRDKRGSGEVVLALDEMDEFLAGTSDVVSEYEQKEFLTMLNRFLYSLPERERNIFILRYFYMDSTQSIAQACSIKESNVLMILSRTRKKLKETLEREGYTI